MAMDKKSLGNPSGQFSDEQAKGFKQGSIPSKSFEQFHEGGASPSTPPEKQSNVQKEDKA